MMKYVIPLDRQSLINIPNALGEKVYFGGPYDLVELLQEPQVRGDEVVDWRSVHVSHANGVAARSVQIDIACKPHHTSESGWSASTIVSQILRYLYRANINSPILGAVELEVCYQIQGVHKQFAVESTKVIRGVYVDPSSRGNGIARILLAEVLSDAPDVSVYPQFSEDGARLFGFDKKRKLHEF